MFVSIMGYINNCVPQTQQNTHQVSVEQAKNAPSFSETYVILMCFVMPYD